MTAVRPVRCSHCVDPGQGADAPSPAPGASPSHGLATVVAEMSLSGAARAPQAQSVVPPQHRRQQQVAAAIGPRGAPSYYAAIDCATCGLPLGGTGIVVRGRVVHDSLACSVGTPRHPAGDEGELLRARAARMGAVSLTAQAAGASENPLAPAIRLADAIEQRRLEAVRRRSASADLRTPAQRRPDRPDGRPRDSAPFVLENVAGGEAAGSILSRTRMSEAIAPARLVEIVRCIDGGCDAARCRFAPTPCTGCHRSLHVAECGRFGSGRAAMGLFTCHYCRALEMAPGRVATPELMRSAKQSMVLELSLGAESTAASVAQYNQLEADFVLEKGLAGDELLLPRHRLETFIAFLLWCSLDAGRARSMGGLWRTMGAIFGAWSLPDLTRNPRAKRVHRKITSMIDLPHVQRTAATRRMLVSMLHDVIPAEEASQLISTRERLCLGLEALGGGRLSEVVDSGQGHGVTCNSVSLVRDMLTGAEYVDILIETSKTGHARYTGAVGMTASGVHLARYLREYWTAFSVETESFEAGGLQVRRGARWTVRLNLLSFDRTRQDDLERLLRSSTSLSAVRHANETVAYVRERLAAVGPGSETKKFVNIAAGGHGSVALKRLMGELQAAGFGQPGDGSYHLVPAPLLVATARGGRSASLMPMGSQTIYGKIGGYLGKAAAAVAAAGDDPDFHIPTAQLASALWGSHSLRRLSDGVVRDYCMQHGISLDRVDARMGWKEAERLRDMQTYYEEEHLRRRIRSMMLTSEM